MTCRRCEREWRATQRVVSGHQAAQPDDPAPLID
jgi:hypothetical protein